MVEEAENLVLTLLREIRTKLDEHDGRLGRIEQRIEEVHETMYTVAGFAMHANVRHDGVTQRLKALEQRVGRLEEKA